MDSNKKNIPTSSDYMSPEVKAVELSTSNTLASSDTSLEDPIEGSDWNW